MSVELAAALAFHAADCCVIPAATDGTKAPFGRWQRYQAERPDEQQLRTWFGAGHPGIGVVTGTVSGNLEMLEFEGDAVRQGLLAVTRELALAAGLGDVWSAITRGYMEATPGGGVHLLYRLDGPVPGNTKVATGPGRKVLAETRGEGGFVVVAPSHGPVHPSGRPWTLATGSPAAIPMISAADRDAIHGVIRTLGEPSPAFQQPPSEQHGPAGGLKPGEDYNQRASWADILAGWTLVQQLGDVGYWRRPGKQAGISATTDRPPYRNLYVFSTSTEFEPEKPYSRFGAYALLNHRGDHTAAAAQLAREGYGDQPRPEPGRQADDAAATAPDPVRPDRHKVKAGNRNPVDIADDVAEHLLESNDPPRLFSMGPAAVLLKDGKLPPLDADGWLFYVARRVTFTVPSKDGEPRIVAPRPAVMKLIPSVVIPELPPLDGIATTPYLDRDGNVSPPMATTRAPAWCCTPAASASRRSATCPATRTSPRPSSC